MFKPIRHCYTFLTSLSLSLWLTFGIMLFLGVGSFVSGGESGSINDMPLFDWLRGAPIAVSWWLWVTLALIAGLVVNTIVCSIESLRSKVGKSRFFVLIAPQVMHLGFLFIVLAHLFSAWGGFKQSIEAREGTTISFPDGSGVRVESIRATRGKMGMVTDFAADILTIGTGGGEKATLGPNRPFFHLGFGLYLKHVEPVPNPSAYLEVHREPGAGLALAGALFFTVGNLVLLAVRRGR